MPQHSNHRGPRRRRQKDSNLGCRLFSFITLSMSCHSLLAWRVSIVRPAVILMGIPLCVICCFSLAAFNICSLCLIFVNLINTCFGVFRFGFIVFGTLCISWTWVIISFPILGKFSMIISSSIFFLFVFFYCTQQGSHSNMKEKSKALQTTKSWENSAPPNQLSNKW